WRDRSDGVDAVADLQCYLLDSELRVGGLQCLSQRQQLTEADVDGAEPAALRAGVPDEEPYVLLLLGRTVGLAGHTSHLVQLVVDDADRHQRDVRGPALAEGVHEVCEQPKARRPQLAGAGATALEVPLEIEALLDQVAQVMPQRKLVDVVVADVAP